MSPERLSCPPALISTWTLKSSAAQHAGRFTYSQISFEQRRLVNNQFWLYLTFRADSDCTDQNHNDRRATTDTGVTGEWELIKFLLPL